MAGPQRACWTTATRTGENAPMLSPRTRSVVLTACLGTALLLAASDARAQGGPDVATAQALFDDAKKLIAAGKYAEACPKFMASHRLDPKVGTLLNLADCHEKIGQTASAWARFLEGKT